MPAASTKRKKTSARKKENDVAAYPEERLLIISLIAAVASGAILGLSAPGLEQWYLAWFGLIPWLLLVVSSRNVGESFLRGLTFGFAYNLVYFNWILGMHPLTWLGYSDWQSLLMALASWVAVCLHQGLIIGCVSVLCRAVPLCGGFLPAKVDERWCLPSLLFIPAAWVLITNKLGNASNLLGMPWSMLEYSQYRQLPLIQVSNLLGGIGLGFLIVLVNVALAGWLATITQKYTWRVLAHTGFKTCLAQLSIVLLMPLICWFYGSSSLAAYKTQPNQTVSVLQGNINIDMQKRQHHYTLEELLGYYRNMTARCAPGLCIWTESALPAYLRHESTATSVLGSLAKNRHLDMVVGSLDYDTLAHPFNSAFGITSSGILLSDTYHKRYLVPFGEYMPIFVKYLPVWIQRLTSSAAGSGYAAGHTPTVLRLNSGSIAPLICFETMSADLVASSVRAGGGLLVNLSELGWFHDSMLGEQMLAFSVFRAVENHRYFVFAANSGPSAIIDPTGRITARSTMSKPEVLHGNIAFSSEITPFTWWFR